MAFPTSAFFRLTDERRALIEHFVRFRYLRTSHLYELYQAGLNVTDRAVRRLVRDLGAHGYLHRRVAPTVGTRPVPGEFAYWLSRKGVGLAEAAGLTTELLPAPRPGIARTLEHELAITDFHLAVLRFSTSENVTLYWKQYGLRRGVNPDALFAITDSSKPEAESTSYGFLEIERSRQGGYAGGRSVLLRRLKRYAAYQGSPECLQDWQWFDEFRVVIVVASEARRRNLLALLADELPLAMFWVTVEGSDFGSAAFSSPVDFRVRGYSLTE